MKSAASYFSVSLPLVKENLRRYWAIPALSFLVYFLSGVFPILISYGEINDRYHFIDSMLLNQHAGFMLAHLMVPIITGVITFRYLQTSASVTSVHAMPFTRAKLFNSAFLSGLIISVAPVVVTGMIFLLMSKPVSPPYYEASTASLGMLVTFTHTQILYWMWESFIIILFIYAITVFAGILTGNSIMHLLTALAFNFLLPALCGIFIMYCDNYLYGFTAGETARNILALSPYLETFNHAAAFPWFLQILYVLSAVIILAAAFFLCYKRQFERTSDSFVFNFMIPVVSFLTAFFGMTLLGYYFKAINSGEVYVYIGMLSGAIIFFLIGRMIVKKTFRVFNMKTIRSMAIYLLLAVFFVSSFAFDITGFEKRVPRENAIRSVTLTGLYIFSDRPNILLASDENIAAFLDVHKSLTSPAEDPRLFGYTSWITLKYDLKGFFNMSRAYSIDYKQLKDSGGLKKIFESKEFKSEPLVSIPAENLLHIVISNPSFSGSTLATVTGRNNMKELLECVERDFKAQPYEDVISLKTNYVNLRLEPEDGRIQNSYVAQNIHVTRNYKNTIKWLKSHGYAEQIEITADMIAKIDVVEYNYTIPPDSDKRYTEPYASSPASAVNSAYITDKAQIAGMIETLQDSHYKRHYYECTIFFEPEFASNFRESVTAILYYDEGELPPFVEKSWV